MGRKNNGLSKIVSTILWIVAVLVSIGVGGLFINGTFTETVLLEFLPLIVHQIAGWIIIGSTILGAVMKIFGK